MSQIDMKEKYKMKTLNNIWLDANIARNPSNITATVVVIVPFVTGVCCFS